MTRETTTSTLDVILTRVHARIVAACPSASNDNTYISTVSMELPPNPDEKMLEISPSQSWSFEMPHFTGAGRNAMHTIGQINITVHSTLSADEVGRDKEFLTHSDHGIIKLMTEVLSALADHDLLDASGNELLSEPMRPIQAQIPPKDDRTRGFVTISFEVRFDWYINPTEP